MSFFDGVNQDQSGNFEMGSDPAPIPKGTQVLAVCEEAKHAEYQGDYYLNLKWRVHKPEQYANRVIFQKLRVYDGDADKAKRAKQMLFAIATNAGGRLFEAMKAAQETTPSDHSLSRLTNVPMVLKLDVWQTDDKTKSGNWVQAVAPHGNRQAPAQQQAPAGPQGPIVAPAPVQPAALAQPAAPVQQAPVQPAAPFDSFDDPIPF